MRGGTKCTDRFIFVIATSFSRKCVFSLFDCFYYRVRQFFVNTKFGIFGGNPPFTPLNNHNILEFSKLTPHDLITSCNTMFLLLNQLLLSKYGCLQKTRAQNIEILTNGAHFVENKFVVIFLF